MEQRILQRQNFDAKSTIECGQVFRYFPLGENEYNIISLDKKCYIKSENDTTIIKSNDLEYFYNYFDLATDYGKIVQHLASFPELTKCVNFGKGIRILRQDLYETIVSFIISANNNITRIRAIIERLCSNFGTLIDDYHAFPTISQLLPCTQSMYKDLGLGYRANYMYDTIRVLNDSMQDLINTPQNDIVDKLKTLKGVGPKVADCIALFGLHMTNNYPVDTWIFKANKTDKLNTPKLVREYYMNRYGEYAGFAQQYIFYHQRSEKNNK